MNFFFYFVIWWHWRSWLQLQQLQWRRPRKLKLILHSSIHCSLGKKPKIPIVIVIVIIIQLLIDRSMIILSLSLFPCVCDSYVLKLGKRNNNSDWQPKKIEQQQQTIKYLTESLITLSYIIYLPLWLIALSIVCCLWYIYTLPLYCYK